MTKFAKERAELVGLGQHVITVQFGVRNSLLGPSEDGGKAPKGLIMSQGPALLETGAK